MSEKTSTASSQKETTYDAIKRKWEAVYTSIHPSYVSSESGNRGTGEGGGGARAPFQYFKNYKELVRKGALYPPPQYRVTNGAPPPPPPPPPSPQRSPRIVREI